MADPFLGQITVYPYSFPPSGWADCAGQLLPISQNAALFSLLGTQYGGNGTSTFALPNLQGTVAVGQGQQTGGSTYIVGESGGAENVTILTGSMPSHTHSVNANTARSSVPTPAGELLATVDSGTPTALNKGDIYNTAAPDTSLTPASTGLAGGNQAHNNIQPFLVLRYCIALRGVFPSRN
jgi:microcystin-dependent protein